jgi:hypothetical protein
MKKTQYSKKRKIKNPLNQSGDKLFTESSSKTAKNIHLASEKVLSKEWLSKKENKAWKNL